MHPKGPIVAPASVARTLPWGLDLGQAAVVPQTRGSLAQGILKGSSQENGRHWTAILSMG